MRGNVRVAFTGITLAALLCAARYGHGEALITCGWDEVRALTIAGTNVATLWTWTATNSNLPEWCKPLFATTDECKPCPDGMVLVTSSGGESLDGAVALVEPRSSNVLFYARAPNAHSADLLPAARVAVALSYHTNGNRLVIFNLQEPNVELFSVPLGGAHGVVWDEPRQVLWGLSEICIREYQLQDWDSHPQLRELSTTPLPEIGGHDMYPVPHSEDMTVATGWHCWLFNRTTRTFTPHPLLGNVQAVKGISVHPATGQIVWVQSEIQWWSERLRFLSPELTLHFPGAHFYKARWLPPDPPRLSIACTSTNTVVVRWPSTSVRFSLQESTNLGAANWVTPTEPLHDDGTDRCMIVDPTASPRFYRLRTATP